ncbi:MAG: HAMP domain-containing histidine kinase [Oscillospiraceae bacterium]|nr:HAMP domain-containing histidine kinase [Oscillospiraceae bacterium]MDE6840395.1 HAMP domain-containing histidine kinase [Oscillospiraceae bacterium]
MLPWLLCAALAAIVLVLCVRLYLLQTSLDDIAGQLGDRLASDTNNLIFLPTRDPHARKLAAELNVQLRELRRLRQRYENGDRELKEAVTNVSHDLRTPLTAICGYLELLDKGDKTPDQARYLALMADRAEAMRQLTGELLRYSVSASLEDELALEPVDLNGAVEEAVAALYGALIEGGVVPSVSLPGERVVRRLDRAALSRVLGNLLSNALKYSAGDLEVSLTPDGTVTLANAAPGLDEVQVGRLFDRFYTVETGRGSTGLGLSIAKVLTERMGGTIAARYESGRLAMALRFPPQPPPAAGSNLYS